MFERRQVAPVLGSVAVALAVGLALTGGAGSAQEASPAASPDALGTEPYPAAIVTGTCDAPGDVAFDLSDVGAAAAQGATPPAGETGVLAAGLTQVDAAVEDVLADEHAVVVLGVGDQADEIVACGDIEGAGDPEQGQASSGQVLARLDERNESGLRGQTILTEFGSNAMNVTVMLVRAESAALATPAP